MSATARSWQTSSVQAWRAGVLGLVGQVISATIPQPASTAQKRPQMTDGQTAIAVFQ